MSEEIRNPEESKWYVVHTYSGYENKVMTIPWLMFNMVQSQKTENLLTAATIGIMFSVFMLPFTLGIRFLLESVTPDVDF